MEKKTKWGIIGCGSIAHSFAAGLQVLEDCELAAVASRSPGKAEAFAREFGVTVHYEDYESLVKNPEVDVIYVATTHNFHYENTLLCLENNKPVLCEKAFTVNAKQAEHLIRTAREQKLFLMEAMWTRFLPATVEIRRLLSEKVIGEVKMLRADFGFVADPNPLGRMQNRNLAGGSLLDLGIYPISYARMVFGKQPARMQTFGHLNSTGVDDQAGYLFEYGTDQMALLSSSMIMQAPYDALIAGTNGYIKLHDFFFPKGMTIKVGSEEEKAIEMPYESTGYNYEAREVNRCLREGLMESNLMPLDETLETMKTMDELRRCWGLRYPEEE